MMYDFDPAEARDVLVSGIQRIARQGSFSKAVVGISGGKDSAVTAALCARALGKENVYGVLLPDGNQGDIKDSYAVCQALGIPHITVNIGKIHASLCGALHHANQFAAHDMDVPASQEANINVAPRLRMTVLRYITQALGARLAGTGNLSEMTVGYCTKDGDTSCDFSVLGDLTSVEVVQVGLTMPEIPRGLVLKTPSDGLSGVSDEEKLGVSYEDIHKYIRGLEGVPQEAAEKIQEKQKKNAHKRQLPPLLHYSPTIRDEF